MANRRARCPFATLSQPAKEQARTSQRRHVKGPRVGKTQRGKPHIRSAVQRASRFCLRQDGARLVDP